MNPFGPTLRIGRLEYLIYSLIWTFSIKSFVYVVVAVMILLGADGESTTLFRVNLLGNLAVIIGVIGFSAKRLRDFDTGGEWSLFILVPLVNIVYILVLLVRLGDRGANEYGNRERLTFPLKMEFLKKRLS